MKRITVQTSVESDIDKVWEYKKTLGYYKLDFETDEWFSPKAEIDLKPTEKFSWRMKPKDGSMGLDFEGTRNKVVPKELIRRDTERKNRC